MRFLFSYQKNNKFLFYLKGYLSLLIPKYFNKVSLQKILDSIPYNKLKEIKLRVNYYNKIENKIVPSNDWKFLSDLKLSKKGKTYFFDAYNTTRFFKNHRANFLFGDINYIPNRPSFVKSRPISENNQNSILLKLNKVRHFVFVNDKIPIAKKKNILFGRAVVNQNQRIDFYKKYFDNKLCDLGQINKGTKYDHWYKKKVTIDYHLKHKFILCIEGYDVASNLKWVMSSSSVAVMPKPKYESWFMEGKLIPDYHYVLIKDDYSDLEEKLNYYINNLNKLKFISKNANQYVSKFRDTKTEKIISLLVMEKFFSITSQKKSSIDFFS